MIDRIRSRLRVLQAERDVLDRAIAELSALLTLEGVPEEAPDPEPELARPREVPPGKPAAPPPGGEPRGSRKDWPQLLRAALADGPKRMGQLAAELGSTLGTIRPHLEGNPWFEKLDPSNRMSPWQLTAAGGSAATAGSSP